MVKVYRTLSSYEKIFRVEIDEETKTVEIYADAWEELIPKKLNLKTIINFEKKEHIMTLTYEKYYVGNSYYDSLDMNTLNSDKLVVKKRLDTSYIGNSILFHIEENEYIFIGHLIGRIIINERVLDYFSPVYKGNSYPYIVGEKNVYLLILCGVVPKKYFENLNLSLPQNYASTVSSWKKLQREMINNEKNQSVLIPDYIEFGVPPLK